VIRLPKKLLFAVEAVLDIAYNAGTQPVQSKEITARQGIPRRYLEQVLQKLVRAGILSGVRGPRGGYLLARERRRITLGDITRVISTPDGNGLDGNGLDGNGLDWLGVGCGPTGFLLTLRVTTAVILMRSPGNS